MLPPTRNPVMVGRDRERRILSDFVSGPGPACRGLLLTGDPGVGKTALVDEAAGAAAREGLVVVRAAGSEHEADLPYATLHQLLLPLHAEIERLPGWDRRALRSAIGGGAPADLLAVGHATLTVLRHRARPTGLLVVVDDLSWLDRETAAVLAFVARRLDGGRVRFLAAGRRGGARTWGPPRAAELTVRPLAAADAALLLDQHHPLLPVNLRQRVLVEARGNPLALLELPTAFRERPGTGAAADPVDGVPMTRHLQAAFGAGLPALSEGARRLLLLAALDATGDLRFLAAAGGLRDATHHLLEAERGGLARVDEAAHRFTFTHPLTRSAVVVGSTAAERRRAHQDLATLYADEPERRSRHLAATAVEPDETLAAALEDAARRSLRRGDARTTVSMLVRSAELSPSPRDRSRRLAGAAHVSAEVAGAPERARGLLADAASTDPGDGPSLEIATSATLLLTTGDGDLDVANRLLSSALATAEDRGDIGRRAHEDALHTLLRICSLGRRAERWAGFRAHLDRLADPPPELTTGWRTLSDPARSAAPALEELDTAIAALTTASDPTRIVRLSLAGMFVDRTGDCRRPLWRVVRDGRAGGAAGSAVTALALLAQDAFRSGDWEAADILAAESESTAEACGGYGSVHARHTRAFVAAARGDVHAVQQITDELHQWARPRGVDASTWAPRCLAAITTGDFDEAYLQATSAGPAGVLPPYVPYALGAVLDLVEAAVRTGRRTEAETHVRAVQRAGLENLSSRLALLARGAAAVAAPDPHCIDLFRSALALPENTRWPFEQARVQLLFGERLRRLRRVGEARSQLSAALSTFRRLAADHWVSRTDAELRATGVPTATSGAPASGTPVDALTPQERKVVDLAASGLTNKQIGERLFLSPRTVGFHLSRAFPKLGVGSRSALRDALTVGAAR